jgi:hypothetical protein
MRRMHVNFKGNPQRDEVLLKVRKYPMSLAALNIPKGDTSISIAK